MKRTALTALVVTAMAACTSEKPPQQVVGEALIREGQRQMEPVQKALNQSLTDWGEKLAQDEAERKERLRRARQGEPHPQLRNRWRQDLREPWKSLPS